MFTTDLLYIASSSFPIDKQASVACKHTALCCRLGRKAVRLSYTASVYTCKIEALSQGLKYHTSASHRLSFKSSDGHTDRMDAANSLRMSYGFRWRLKLCQSQGTEHKRCFQDCCERKQREKQAQAKTTAQRRKKQIPWAKQRKNTQVFRSWWTLDNTKAYFVNILWMVK